MICVPRSVENTVVKGENAGYQYFLLYPQCFQEAVHFRVVKSREHVVKCERLVVNIAGKGENAGYHIFSFSHNVFKRPKVVKSLDCVLKGGVIQRLRVKSHFPRPG